MSIFGKIHSIETFGAVDGPGVRFVIFLQGCPLKCLYCHNPDSRDYNSGYLTTAEEMFEKIMRYRNYIKNGGVTLSGGEPLSQIQFSLKIIELCKENNIHTAVDTSGAIPLSQSKIVIDKVDLLLLDIKDIEDNDCINLTGFSNKNALETLNYCEKINKDVFIRHVLVPNYTLNAEKLNKLADYCKKFSVIKRVELLPFHKMGENKYRELNIPYKLYDLKEPTDNEIKEAKKIFEQRGLDVY